MMIKPYNEENKEFNDLEFDNISLEEDVNENK